MNNRGSVLLAVTMCVLVVAVFVFIIMKSYEAVDKASIKTLKNETRVIWIDKCEYVTFKTAYAYVGVTHKGDCKNPIHPENR